MAPAMPLKLYQFPPALGLPNASPFCMKLETWLRMAGIAFESVYTMDVRRAPKGKLPYIDDDGRIVADSNLVIRYLTAKHGDLLDGWLLPAERAVSLALRRLIEENLYWAVLYGRWIDESGWAMTRKAFFARMRAPWRWFVPGLARAGVRRSIGGHGMGRHSSDEIYAIGKADIDAVADYLGDKPYLMGGEPSSVDASAYATFANILWAPHDTPLRARLAQRPGAVAYCERMKARYYAAPAKGDR
jgi:glutathione S-transferase